MAEHDLKLLSISSDLPVPRLEPASNDVQEPSALELLLASALLASQSKALSASPEPSSVQIAELKKLCRGEAPSLVASGLCTASLFLKGKAAVFANALTFSLDEWHPFSSKTGIGNYEPVFGAAKGLAIKAIYSRWGAIDALRLLTPTQLDLTTKATLLGFSSRVCSSIFSVSNWQGPQGEIDPSRLIRTTAAAAFSPALICTDLFVSASCKSVEHILERTNTGVLERNAVLSNSFLGAWLGCSTGASAEIQKEMQEKKQLEPGSIFSSACKHAFVNALAVLPAGMQSHFESSRIYQNIKILEDHPDAKIPESRRDFEIGAGCKRPARVPFESCPSHYPCDEQKDLRLPAPPVIPLAELTASLGKSTTTQEDILLQRSGVKGQFTARSLTQLGIDEYLRTTTRVERQRVIVHNPDGLGGEIAVPFEYSKVLDLVRKERLSFESKQFSDLRSSNGNAAQGMEWKALPEDLAKLLREVPNNQLVKRANLYNHHCPHDALFGFEAAATATKGTINFYKRTNNEDLRVTTNHEWSHLLHDANPDLFRLYKSAANIEKALLRPEANACDYARSNYCENWAVHLGEELLASEPNRMISMLEYAPLRTAILGRALRKSINELEHCDNVKSVYSHQFLARTDFIEEVGRKRAIESIRESLTNGCLDFDRIELLEWLTGKKFDVATLKSKAGGFEMRLELFDCLFGK